MLFDFSENYFYVIQVQGYSWVQDSYSLRSVVIYTCFENSGNIVIKYLCVLSGNLEHDIVFIYETRKIASQFLKDLFPKIKDINNFSNGCASQFKNYKNFINTCDHSQCFSLITTWVFFITRHGKFSCDVIGAFIKWLVSIDSLQIFAGNTIDNIQKVMKVPQIQHS